MDEARCAPHNGGVVHAERQRRCRPIFKSRSGIGTARWLLIVVLAAATTAVSSDDSATKDQVVSECRRLYDDAKSLSSLPVIFSKDDHVQIKSESRGGRTLLSFLKLHELHTVDERDNGRTVLCVGLVDATSFSSKVDAGDPDVVFSIDTFKEVPIGFVRVGTMCWLNYQRFRDCEPSFTPVPYFSNLPLYHHSPLEEDFWNKMSVETGLKQNWIWKVNSYTKKGSIPAEWIHKMNISSLQSLKISGNDWRRPKNILKPMPHLQLLALPLNKLEALPEDMLIGMPSLRTLILAANNISYPRSVRYLRALNRLDLTNPTGDAVLRIEDEDIKDFPETLHNFGAENSNLQANVSNILMLPHLSFLNLSGCALGHINDLELREVKSGLVTIDLSNNGLKELPSNIFNEMPKLKELLINNNDFEEWPEDILISNSLTLLVLTHNRISKLTSETFQNLGMLEILVMPWNKIQYLSDKTFQNLQNLKILVLSHNKLTRIPDMLFKSTPRLMSIHLEDNMLTKGPNLWQLRLDILNLSNNDLNYFSNTNLSSIGKLDLSHNFVSNVDISYTIEKMNISHNSLAYISQNLWTNLIQLKEIDIGGNEFKCCLFGNRTYLNEFHMTEILNLGTMIPITCSINQTSPKILLETFVYNETECSSFQYVTSIGMEVVLPLTLLILTGIIVAVAMYVYGFERMHVKHLFKRKGISVESVKERC